MKSFLSLIAVIMAGTVFADIDLPERFETKDGFTIRMPEGWIAIPREMIQALADENAKSLPNAPKVIYDYGFQSADSENWFEYPYLVIQVRRIGRLPESELNPIKKINTLLNESGKVIDRDYSGLSDLEFNETIYDPELHIILTRLSAECPPYGRVRCLSGTRLTEFGSIGIYCYALESTYSYYAPVFEAIIKQVEIPDSIAYTVRWTDTIPFLRGIDWPSAIGKVIGITMVMTLSGWLYGLGKKKNKKDPKVLTQKRGVKRVAKSRQRLPFETWCDRNAEGMNFHDILNNYIQEYDLAPDEHERPAAPVQGDMRLSEFYTAMAEHEKALESHDRGIRERRQTEIELLRELVGSLEPSAQERVRDLINSKQLSLAMHNNPSSRYERAYEMYLNLAEIERSREKK